MENFKKPSLICGLACHIAFLVTLLLMANDNPYSTWIMYVGLAMGAVYWITTIIEVSTVGRGELKKHQKSFLLIFGDRHSDVWCIFLNDIVHQQRRKIAA